MAQFVAKQSRRTKTAAAANEEPVRNQAHHWESLSIPRVCLVSGCCDVVLGAVTYPLWYLKTRDQMVSGAPRATLKVASSIVRQHGVKGLYRGAVFGTVGVLPAHNAYLLSYEWSKYRLGFWLPHSCVPAVAAAFAESSYAALATPVEVATVRVQCADPSAADRRSALAELRDLWRGGGIRRLYCGGGLTLATALPQGAIWWLTYENCKALVPDSRAATSAWVCLGASTAASLVATLLANPLDVLKTRVQLTGKSSLGVVAREEPLGRLFTRGLGPRLLTAVVAGLFESATYEAVMHYGRVPS